MNAAGTYGPRVPFLEADRHEWWEVLETNLRGPASLCRRLVPAMVRLSGILRTFDERDRVELHGAIEEATRAVTDVHGCDAEVEVTLGAPVLRNDDALAASGTDWLKRVGFTSAPPLRSCGADDFSYYCALVPSLMVFVGVGSEIDAPMDVPGEDLPGSIGSTVPGTYTLVARRNASRSTAEPGLT